jgi:hypothetical protein
MVVMAGAAVIGCGEDSQRESLVDEPVTEIADDERSTTTDGDSTELEPQRYRPGDCIDWEAATFDLKVVDCSSPHRMQVTEEVDGPNVTDYPSNDEWGSYSDEMCGPAAERFLGIEIDPHGRFLTMSIYPQADEWALGDSSVLCGILLWTHGRSDGRSTEDVRTVEQTFAFDAGTCAVDGTADFRLVDHVVGCDQPHDLEVTGRADFGDLTDRPSPDQIAARCAPISESYLGGPPAPPWSFDHGRLGRESWDAGTRTTHCFIVQKDDGGNLLETTGSATD